MNTAVEYLRAAADPGRTQYARARTSVVLAYGILWADESCRTSGTLSMALRRATAEAGRRLLVAIREAGLTTTGEVPRWLNANEQRALEILGQP